MNWVRALLTHWNLPRHPAPQPPKSEVNHVSDLISSLLPGTLAAMPPALKQEQFANTHAEVKRIENRLHTARLRLIAVNNSAIDRDLGRTRDGMVIYGDVRAPLRQELLDALREDSVTEDEYRQLRVEIRTPLPPLTGPVADELYFERETARQVYWQAAQQRPKVILPHDA